MPRYYLGIDLGSSYTKFVVIDPDRATVYRSVIPTLSRNREAFDGQQSHIAKEFDPKGVCATGYGRNSCQSDLQKTELVCAAAGLSIEAPVAKLVLDIGGEDTKIIECGPNGEVTNFHMNDKCSAGTGTFITEIAERSELAMDEMSALARVSKSGRTINSFCTVFAKSEILGWKFEGMPIEDIARGIYLSIIDRIAKMPLRSNLPIYLTGGVIAYHPFLAELLAEQLKVKVKVAQEPQYVVALGAAELARRKFGIG